MQSDQKLSHFKNLKLMLSEIYCLETKETLIWLEWKLDQFLKTSMSWHLFPGVVQDALILEISYLILKNKHILHSQFFYTLFSEYLKTRTKVCDDDIESCFIELRRRFSAEKLIDESTVLTRVSMELKLGLIPPSIQSVLIPGFLTGACVPNNEHQFEIRKIWEALNHALERRLGVEESTWASEYVSLRTKPFLRIGTPIDTSEYMAALVSLMSNQKVQKTSADCWAPLLASGFIFEANPIARNPSKQYGLTELGKKVTGYYLGNSGFSNKHLIPSQTFATKEDLL